MNTINTDTTSHNAAKTSAKAPKSPKTAPAPAAPTTPRRGLRKTEVVELLKNFTFPAEPFTIKQACTSLGADHWLIHTYVKANAQIVGDAPKASGPNGKTRGKHAKLYQLPSDKLVF
jgi:hypothetical protein